MGLACFCQVHEAPQHGNTSWHFSNLASLFGYLLVSIVNVKINLSDTERMWGSKLFNLEKKAWIMFLKYANLKIKLLWSFHWYIAQLLGLDWILKDRVFKILHANDKNNSCFLMCSSVSWKSFVAFFSWKILWFLYYTTSVIKAFKSITFASWIDHWDLRFG